VDEASQQFHVETMRDHEQMPGRAVRIACERR